MELVIKMMGKKNSIDKKQVEIISLDQLVPRNHLVRKLEEAIDLSFIYLLVKDLYSPYGKESIDPVVLIKLNIIQYTFGIRSMRQTIKETEVNCAYRWYIGYGFNEKIPHFSTFSKNYTRRFEGTDLFEQIFVRVIEEIISHGFIEEETVFIDGTHIKANANSHKYRKEIVEKSSKYYEDELRKEINQDREARGKKPLKEAGNSDPKTKEIKASKTDPDCGVFHKGEHKKVFAYTTSVACDKNSFILDFELAAGNIHDSTVFPQIYGKLIKKYPDIENVVLDAGYKTPAIARQIIKDNRTPIMPYKRPMTKDGFYRKYEYVYDEYYDCYICNTVSCLRLTQFSDSMRFSLRAFGTGFRAFRVRFIVSLFSKKQYKNNEVLKYSTTNREGYREYKSNPAACKNCPHLNKCTQSKNHTKVITRHIWEEYIEQAEDIRHTVGTKQIYNERKETIERVFADAKELHGMRYAKHRGHGKVRMELDLLFMCMNLKKLAKRLWRGSRFPSLLRCFPLPQEFYKYFPRKIQTAS